jgi:hypothetical protein
MIRRAGSKATGTGTTKTCLARPREGRRHSRKSHVLRNTEAALFLAASSSAIVILPSCPGTSIGRILRGDVSAAHGGMVLRSTAIPRTPQLPDTNHLFVRQDMFGFLSRTWVFRHPSSAAWDHSAEVWVALPRSNAHPLCHSDETLPSREMDGRVDSNLLSLAHARLAKLDMKKLAPIHRRGVVAIYETTSRRRAVALATIPAQTR